jgi:hypothetical protein
MLLRPRVGALLSGAALVAAGCSEYLPLPETGPPPSALACSSDGVAGPWALAGDPDAVPHVWAVGPDGTRHEVSWPSGFKSVFWPELLVLNEDSRTVGHEGDDLLAPPASYDGLVVCVTDAGAAVYREADLP